MRNGRDGGGNGGGRSGGRFRGGGGLFDRLKSRNQGGAPPPGRPDRSAQPDAPTVASDAGAQTRKMLGKGSNDMGAMAPDTGGHGGGQDVGAYTRSLMGGGSAALDSVGSQPTPATNASGPESGAPTARRRLRMRDRMGSGVTS